jgi:anti-sigma B factor antagonist
MKIDKLEKQKHIVLHVQGSLSVENISSFQEELNTCLLTGKHVVLELSEVTFIDSSTLGVIVLFYSKMVAEKNHLIIANVKPEIHQMLNLTGVSKKMKVFRAIEDAEDFIKKI